MTETLAPFIRKLWEVKGRKYHAVCTVSTIFRRPTWRHGEKRVTGWFESPLALPPEIFDLSTHLPLIGKGLLAGFEQAVGKRNRQRFVSTGAMWRKRRAG